MASPPAKSQGLDARRQGKGGDDPPPSDDLSDALRSGSESEDEGNDHASISSDENSLLVTPERKRFLSDFMGHKACHDMLAEARDESKEMMASIARRANRKQTKELKAHSSNNAHMICTKVGDEAVATRAEVAALRRTAEKILANQEREERRRQMRERSGGTRRRLGFDDATPGPSTKRRKVEDAKTQEERIAARKAKADRDHCARTRSRK